MIDNFQIGEVVQFRSGGPLVTVMHSASAQTTVMYWNGVSGLFEKFTSHTSCFKPGNYTPQVPASASGLRSNATPKSSLS